MKKYSLIASILFLLIGCSDIIEKRLNKVVGTYIQETQLEDDAYVKVDKIDFDSLYLFRIYASRSFSKEKLPFEIGEVNDHYVFKFQKGQEAIDLKEISEEVKLIEKYRPGVLFYNPPFWIALICKKSGDYKVIKNLLEKVPPAKGTEDIKNQSWWFSPLDSIQTDTVNLKELSDFKCQV